MVNDLCCIRQALVLFVLYFLSLSRVVVYNAKSLMDIITIIDINLIKFRLKIKLNMWLIAPKGATPAN